MPDDQGWSTEKLVFFSTVVFLGLVALAVIGVVGVNVYTGKTTPDGLIALGSASVGAMAGLLAPSPAKGT